MWRTVHRVKVTPSPVSTYYSALHDVHLLCVVKQAWTHESVNVHTHESVHVLVVCFTELCDGLVLCVRIVDLMSSPLVFPCSDLPLKLSP